MRIFGEIDGVSPNSEYKDRAALAKVGVHSPLVAGISGSESEGADSIVLSGGYEDDEDYGDEIIYTGAGGQENNRQVADQTLTRVNLALAKSKVEGFPVRVSRGHNHKHPQSPKSGYKYCGLYYVEDYWQEPGVSGYKVWRFRLVASSNYKFTFNVSEPGLEYSPPKRQQILVQRIVRNSLTAKNVKKWHEYKCQVCGVALETSAGLYAEAAHIQPLGKPHNGPDFESNILCLCPNHHVLFDNGGFTINDDLTLNIIRGRLRVVKKHKIDVTYLHYHREHYEKSA